MKAFGRLEGELFQLEWVEAVATEGFTRPPDSRRAGLRVYVVTSEMPTGVMQREMEKIVTEVNHRYGTKLKATAVERKWFRSGLRSMNST